MTKEKFIEIIEKHNNKDFKSELGKAFTIISELREIYLYKEKPENQIIWLEVCSLIGAPELTAEEKAKQNIKSALTLGGIGSGCKTEKPPNYDYKKDGGDHQHSTETNKDYLDLT